MRILPLVLLTIAVTVSAAEPPAKPPRHAAHSAQQPPQPQSAPAQAQAQAQAQQQQQAPAPTLELKNKSSFKMDNGSRSPFWPIGWKPTAKIAHTDTDQAGSDIPPTAFAVTSITLGAGGHFAIINGKIMGEGQQFGLQIGSQTYQITVKSIEDGQVILSRRDQEIAVPLRRK